MSAQRPHLSELCWSDQEVNLYPVRSRMQEHRGHVATGDALRDNSIEGATCRSSEKGQEAKEAKEKGPGRAGAGEEGTGSETETTVSTRISTIWGRKGQRWSAQERPRWEKGGTI